MAEPDFVINTTAGGDGRLAGVFAGAMEDAHRAAVAHLRSFSQISLDREYDVVVTHAGHVGVNHYQAAKAAYSAVRAAKSQGWVVLVADTIDPEPLGSPSYRSLMSLLKDIGHEAFMSMIQAEDWRLRRGSMAGADVGEDLCARAFLASVLFQSPDADGRLCPFATGRSPGRGR